MAHKALMTTIRPADAMAVAKREDRFNEIMPIDAIARAVGAHQIIYVQMVSFQTSPDGYTPRPTASCLVKVIDVINGVRLFPAADNPTEAHSLNYTMSPISTDLYSRRAGIDEMKIYEMLSVEMGDQLAKLFYTHETKELGGQLGSRR